MSDKLLTAFLFFFFFWDARESYRFCGLYKAGFPTANLEQLAILFHPPLVIQCFFFEGHVERHAVAVSLRLAQHSGGRVFNGTRLSPRGRFKKPTSGSPRASQLPGVSDSIADTPFFSSPGLGVKEPFSRRRVEAQSRGVEVRAAWRLFNGGGGSSDHGTRTERGEA